MNKNLTFGQWVKQLRAQRDLTQEMLVEEVACAVQTISSIERGARRPSREMAARMADVLQVAPQQRDAFLELARRVASNDAPAETLPLPLPEPVPAATLPTRRFRSAASLTHLIGRAHELQEI